MKQFEDLEFKQHPSGTGLVARLNFDNGYGVSVVRFVGAYADQFSWEVAILKNDKLCYTTDLTNDVLGYQSEENINKIMTKLQRKENTYDNH